MQVNPISIRIINITRMKNIQRFIFIFATTFLISGCSSIGKGVAEAFLEKNEEEDTRVCEVWGGSFSGIKPHLENEQGKMKILMVHGVGDHVPGYSTEFFEKLVKELDLSVTSKRHKDITLLNPNSPEKELGNLRIKHYLNKEKTQELMFYELTWSEITKKEKEVLAYDNSGEYSFRRAEVNDLMKRFSNDTGPDPIIYLGESRKDILISFSQSFCWMTYGNWEELPSDNIKSVCKLPDVSAIINDQYAIVSHSLGSRIAIDGMQHTATVLDGYSEANNVYLDSIKESLQNKIVPIYMMSNQLPMLQLGRKIPESTNQKEAYCTAEGEKYAQRMLTRTPIIAFSDPNDLLSYAIPPGFVEKYLDSRLCIDVTNININIANEYDLFGLGKFANPMDAHIGYDTDDRVVSLIAKGIGNKDTSKLITDRCRWIETID